MTWSSALRPHRLVLVLSSFAGWAALAAMPAGCSDTPRRRPALHRAVSEPCPQERGAGITVSAVCQADSSASLGCDEDSDCAAGPNGRCTGSPGPACSTTCTYDDCHQDADCPGGAACVCRTSAVDANANICAPNDGGCRVDADCCPGGFCSPSLMGRACTCTDPSLCHGDEGGACTVNGVSVPCACSGSCGHGYFCHTAEDKCLDDADCGAGRTCNFDLTSKTWMCTGCVAP